MQKTLFSSEGKHIHYNTVLLIDDFVGSFALLNKAVIKLKTASLQKTIEVAFFCNLDLKYEGINDNVVLYTQVNKKNHPMGGFLLLIYY